MAGIVGSQPGGAGLLNPSAAQISGVLPASLGELVFLSLSGVTTTTFTWAITEKPAGSQAAINQSSPYSARAPACPLDKVGRYVIRFTDSGSTAYTLTLVVPPQLLLQPRYGATFNVSDPRFGARGDGLTDDTAAIASAISAASTLGGTIEFPCGVFMTDPIVLDQNIHSGITLSGAGPRGQFGGDGTILRLRSAGAALLTVQGLRFKFRDMTLDGAGLPTTATVNFAYLASEIEFNRVNIEGAIDTTGTLINFPGTNEIDNVVFRRCRIMQATTDFTKYCRSWVVNNNPNAFNILFEYCYFSNAQYGFDMQQGSCDVRHAQMFLFTASAGRVETYAQQMTWEDVYTEQTAAPFFQQVFNAAGFSNRPLIFRHIQLAHSANSMDFVGTQPVYLDNVVTAGSITMTPQADQAMTGTVTATAASTAVVGVGTLFATEAIAGTMLRIAGELHQVASVADNTHLTLLSAQIVAAAAMAPTRAYGFHRVTSHGTQVLTVGQGFSGTGYPSQVDEISPTKYYGTLPIAQSKRPAVKFDVVGWDSARTVTADDGDDIYIGTLTSNRAYTLSLYNRNTGMAQRFSRVGAGDANTVTINATWVIGRASGAMGWVEILWTGSTYLLFAFGVNP